LSEVAPSRLLASAGNNFRMCVCGVVPCFLLPSVFHFPPSPVELGPLVLVVFLGSLRVGDFCLVFLGPYVLTRPHGSLLPLPLSPFVVLIS